MVTPNAFRQLETDESIIRIKLHITKLNRIYAFITNISFNFNIPLFTLQTRWTDKEGFKNQLLSINAIYQNRIKIDCILHTIKNYNNLRFSKLRVYIAALRNSLRAFRITKENNKKVE